MHRSKFGSFGSKGLGYLFSSLI